MDVMQYPQKHADNKETLYLLGGAAMMVFGAGLILSTPLMRRYVSGMKVRNFVEAAVPDLVRYLKLKTM